MQGPRLEDTHLVPYRSPIEVATLEGSQSLLMSECRHSQIHLRLLQAVSCHHESGLLLFLYCNSYLVVISMSCLSLEESNSPLNQDPHSHSLHPLKKLALAAGIELVRAKAVQIHPLPGFVVS